MNQPPKIPEDEGVWTCVLIESPYNGTAEEIEKNVQYAIHAMRDCLKRHEAPFASHLLYTQAPKSGFVSDDDSRTVCIGRKAAIEAGLAWGSRADKTVVYVDYGITNGMTYGIESAKKANRPIEYRKLEGFGK